MLFSSLTFLCCFLPLVVIIYFLIPLVARNLFLLISSLIFYAWGEPRYLFLMLFVILWNYIAGIVIDKIKIELKKIVCICSVLVNIGILCNYKYIDFFIDNINYFFNQHLELYNVVLPIGISFYIFQSLSYTIDVYRCVVPAQYNLLKFALYVSLFPQLVAGPIVKYKDVMQYLEHRNETIDDVVYGLRRFIVGLGKKVILANTMGEVADKIFSSGPSDISVSIAWLGAVAFTLQVFYDFSGYSDMAIGLGRIFGFKFQENFNYPYVSVTMTELWQRWHMSLTTWFKDYVYIPLGGSRVSNFRHNMNILLIFLATGIWHGANWTFIVWGLWNGLFLLIEKKLGLVKKKFSGNIRLLMHAYVLIVFIVEAVFFRSDSLSIALQYLGVMFYINVNDYIPFDFMYYFNSKIAFIGLFAILFCKKWNYDKWEKNKYYLIFRDIVLILVLITSMSFIAASGYISFIYFKF